MLRLLLLATAALPLAACGGAPTAPANPCHWEMRVTVTLDALPDTLHLSRSGLQLNCPGRP